MMMCKRSSVLLILSVIIAYYGVFSSSLGSVYDIESDVQGAIDRSEKQIQKSVDKATEKLEGLTTDFNSIAGNMAKETLERVQKSIDHADKQIKQLVGAATAAGLNTATCEEGVDSKLQELNAGAETEVNACAGDKSTQAEDNVKSGIEQINLGSQLVVGSFKSDKSACGAGPESETCLGNLLMRVVTSGFTVPTQINSRASEVETNVKNLELAMAECTTRTGNAASKEANIIQVDVGTCVSNLLSEDRVRILAKYNH
ncbi:PREDICTED: uncharacterized protein LOC108557759 [Nicrophorus vespilloides]|uniref:Uncharacterized protein LOC108557759 n=1 Tax=Nicrophorus vespilloides TaxID=110193 RepID=A0ABM1M5Q1_NICVS|nr:PREDICTED: uncharacterized protein LOC108557759 [Nicrophorus vespilloides]